MSFCFFVYMMPIYRLMGLDVAGFTHKKEDGAAQRPRSDIEGLRKVMGG